jgi:hypothetical protein
MSEKCVHSCGGEKCFFLTSPFIEPRLARLPLRSVVPALTKRSTKQVQIWAGVGTSAVPTQARRKTQSGTNFRPFLDSFRICDKCRIDPQSIQNRSGLDQAGIAPRQPHNTGLYLSGIGHVPILELAKSCQNAPQLSKQSAECSANGETRGQSRPPQKQRQFVEMCRLVRMTFPGAYQCSRGPVRVKPAPARRRWRSRGLTRPFAPRPRSPNYLGNVISKVQNQSNVTLIGLPTRLFMPMHSGWNRIFRST